MPRHLAGIPYRKTSQPVSSIGKARSTALPAGLIDPQVAHDAAAQSRMRYQNVEMGSQPTETGDALTKQRIREMRQREMERMMREMGY